jgi:hypothetical protein
VFPLPLNIKSCYIGSMKTLMNLVLIFLVSLGFSQSDETGSKNLEELVNHYVNQEILQDLQLENFTNIRQLQSGIEEVWGPALKVELGPGGRFINGRELRSVRMLHYPLFILQLHSFDAFTYQFSHIVPRTRPYHLFRVGMPFPEEAGEPAIPTTIYELRHGRRKAELRIGLSDTRVVQNIEIYFP